jgi:hypothetical protein
MSIRRTIAAVSLSGLSLFASSVASAQCSNRVVTSSTSTHGHVVYGRVISETVVLNQVVVQATAPVAKPAAAPAPATTPTPTIAATPQMEPSTPVELVKKPLPSIEAAEELEVDVRFAEDKVGQVVMRMGEFETPLQVSHWSADRIRFVTPNIGCTGSGSCNCDDPPPRWVLGARI